jgi:hypothetical protein
MTARATNEPVVANRRSGVGPKTSRTWCSPAGTSNDISPFGGSGVISVGRPSMVARQPGKYVV